MLFQDDHFRKFSDWHGIDYRCGPLKMLRIYIGNKLKTLHFYFSDPRSHLVHRKANTIKKG